MSSKNVVRTVWFKEYVWVDDFLVICHIQSYQQLNTSRVYTPLFYTLLKACSVMPCGWSSSSLENFVSAYEADHQPIDHLPLGELHTMQLQLDYRAEDNTILKNCTM